MATKIKMCGMTRQVDAQVAAGLGVDMLGVVLVPETPRFMSEAAIIREFSSVWANPGATLEFVGVMRNIGDMPGPVAANRFSLFQTYVDPRGANDESVARRWIAAYRVKDEETLNAIKDQGIWGEALLLDAYHPYKLGGAGEKFDWSLAIEAQKRFECPVILAGGLTPENVYGAILKVHPWGVDVSSGIESRPGIKNVDKMTAFVDAVRAADKVLASGR